MDPRVNSILTFCIFLIVMIGLILGIGIVLFPLFKGRPTKIFKKTLGEFFITALSIVMLFSIISIGFVIYQRVQNRNSYANFVNVKTKAHFLDNSDGFLIEGTKYVRFMSNSIDENGSFTFKKGPPKASLEFSEGLFNSFISSLYNLNTVETLYSIRNKCGFDIVEQFGLYCKESQLQKCKDYYKDFRNYNFFVCYGYKADYKLKFTKINMIAKEFEKIRNPYPEYFTSFENGSFKIYAISKDGINFETLDLTREKSGFDYRYFNSDNYALSKHSNDYLDSILPKR